MVEIKKAPLRRINLSLPEDLFIEIEKSIEENYLTRTKWFVDAALMKLSKEKDAKIDRVVKGQKI